MRPADLLTLLRDFYADKRALKSRHEASALAVGDYDSNNTYQYMVNRENAHLAWLREAIESFGGTVPDAPADAAVPAGQPVAGSMASVIDGDLQATRALVARWEGRFRDVTHARHRRMLGVILGEMREHQRFFEQASAGRTDLLGRSAEGARAAGRVLPARWVE